MARRWWPNMPVYCHQRRAIRSSFCVFVWVDPVVVEYYNIYIAPAHQSIYIYLLV